MTFDQVLDQIPATGDGCHPAIMSAANVGILSGLKPDEIFQAIRDSIPTGGKRRVSDREIWDAVDKAARECKPDACASNPDTTYRKPKKARPPIDGAKYRQALIKRSEGVSEADLWEISPYRITWQPGPEDAVHLLDTLCAPDEFFFIGSKYGKTVRTAKQWRDRIANGETDPFIIPNPVGGEEHDTKSGTKSRRCDAAIASYRFALVEFDNLPHAAQLAFWHSIITEELFRVAALIDSGNKSIHAWIRVDLPDADAWQKEIRDGFYHPDTGRMHLLGADRACQNPSRLSRLAGHHRADTGNVQRLLYLNPERTV